MLGGTLAASEIAIIAPRIRLQRDREGRISCGGETAAPDQAGSGDLALDGIIRELLAERRPGNALSYLDEVRIRDGQVFMRDDRLGLSWAAPAAEISQRSDAAGPVGDNSLPLAVRSAIACRPDPKHEESGKSTDP